MTYDHAQSPRLGQRVPVESTTIRMFTGEDLPEVAWHGQMIYRKDTQVLQVYNGEEDAWQDVVGGVAGLLTFVGDTVPVAVNAGDIWFRVVENEPRSMYRASAPGDDEISDTEWVLVMSDLTDIDPALITGGVLDTGAEPLRLASRVVLAGEMELIGRIEASGLGRVGMSGTEGFYVLGPIPDGGTEANRKTLISFPVNGDPNIIAGQLTASTALFTDGASFRGESGIEATAKLVLHGEIRAPKNAPVLSPTWDSTTFEVPTVEHFPWAGIPVLGEAFASDGTDMVGLIYVSNQYAFIRWSMSTGAITDVHDVQSLSRNNDRPCGMVYNPFRDVWQVVFRGSSLASKYAVHTYADLDGPALQKVELTYNPLDFYNSEVGVGVDHATGDLLLTNAVAEDTHHRVYGYATETDGTLTITAGAYPAAYIANLQNTDGNLTGKFIAAGDFDYGSKHYVSKTKWSADLWWQHPHATSGTIADDGQWPTAEDKNIHGGWWNPVISKFQSVTLAASAPTVYTYEGGESVGEIPGLYWENVGYTFYDSNTTDGLHETAMSPITTVLRNSYARAKMRGSFDAWPTTVGTNTPNSIRIWMAPGPNEIPLDADELLLRAESTETALVIWPGTDGGDFATEKEADFPSGSPAEIQSADNGSYWKGDNTAKFLRLNLDSTTDANISANNKPPLITGNPESQHIRYGTEEIISMNSNTSNDVGDLFLNRGGSTIVAQGGNGRFQIGSAGRAVSVMYTGSGSVDTNASGLGTFSHSLNLNNYTVVLTSRQNGAFRHFTVTTKNPNNFVVRVTNHDGTTANSINGIGFDYVIFAVS